jgi:hypothetical protein
MDGLLKLMKELSWWYNIAKELLGFRLTSEDKSSMANFKAYAEKLAEGVEMGVEPCEGDFKRTITYGARILDILCARVTAFLTNSPRYFRGVVGDIGQRAPSTWERRTDEATEAIDQLTALASDDNAPTGKLVESFKRVGEIVGTMRREADAEESERKLEGKRARRRSQASELLALSAGLEVEV